VEQVLDSRTIGQPDGGRKPALWEHGREQDFWIVMVPVRVVRNRVREQFLLAAAAQNVKRLVRFLSQGDGARRGDPCPAPVRSGS
jgi:hypothetical protein